MRKALIVGINDYADFPLTGCVNDANRMADILAKNEDGSPNFGYRRLITPDATITRAELRAQLDELFADSSDIVLFYFSGHGMVNDLGGSLVTQDAKAYDEGVRMGDVLALANKSNAREAVIMLDCCYSGAFGQVPSIPGEHALLRNGVSVLAASSPTQVSMEIGDSGLFTSLIYDGLAGGASDVIGNVTVVSLYAYVDQILGPWDQRPMLKSHVSRLTPIRKCEPHIGLEYLRLLPECFKSSTDELPLDPSYEPSEEPRNKLHERIFELLQKYRAARLLVPIGEEHLYFAAMKSKPCKLTPLGRFYWRLAKDGKL